MKACQARESERSVRAGFASPAGRLPAARGRCGQGDAGRAAASGPPAPLCLGSALPSGPSPPLGISEDCRVDTVFLKSVWREAERRWSSRVLCRPTTSMVQFFPPPPKKYPVYINHEQLHWDVAYLRDFFLPQTLAALLDEISVKSCRVPCQKPSPSPDVWVWQGQDSPERRLQSAAKLSQADCKQVGVSRRKGLCSCNRQVLQCLCCS